MFVTMYECKNNNFDAIAIPDAWNNLHALPPRFGRASNDNRMEHPQN